MPQVRLAAFGEPHNPLERDIAGTCLPVHGRNFLRARDGVLAGDDARRAEFTYVTRHCRECVSS